MPVYVDGAFLPYRRMLMSHMLADTLDELHAMADKIGIARRHFQADASTPHYDICKSKRSLAVQHGAIEIDCRQAVALIRKWREQPSGKGKAQRCCRSKTLVRLAAPTYVEDLESLMMLASARHNWCNRAPSMP